MTKQYLEAARTILNEGTRKPNRTGVDTISAFAVPMRFDLREGFPLLTTKKMSWWNIVAENLWFLSGEPHIGFLQKHGVKFWDAWTDDSGKVPSAYGNFWRHFPVHGAEIRQAPRGLQWRVLEKFNDQIAWVVEQLRTNPMNRRMVVSAWAPGNAQTSKLPPCHCMFALNVQNLRMDTSKGQWFQGESLALETGDDGQLLGENQVAPPEIVEPHLCLHLTQRSCDTFLGVPYNIAGYAFITHVLAHLSGLKVGIFSHMLVDAHFYTRKPDGTMAAGGTHGEDDNTLLDHIPMITEQLTREPRALPRFTIDPYLKTLDDLKILLDAPKDEILDVFKLEGYDPHPALKGAVAV